MKRPESMNCMQHAQLAIACLVLSACAVGCKPTSESSAKDGFNQARLWVSDKVAP